MLVSADMQICEIMNTLYHRDQCMREGGGTGWLDLSPTTFLLGIVF